MTKTIHQSLLLISMVCGSLISTFAQTTKPYEPTYEPSCDPYQLKDDMGVVSLSLGVDHVVGPTMSCLLKMWRDNPAGRTRFYVSNAFFSIIEENPPLFFSMMTKEPMIFNDWLNDIENLSFTWPLNPPCQLEATRKHIISVLEHSVVASGQPSTLKLAVIKKLSSVRCRQLH